MTDDAQRWKEKYLKSVEDQEKLERRWNARLDLLRLGLVRSTLAAEGADKAVDECMQEMREVVRTDNMDAALANLIPRLERTVLASEQRREARLEQVSAALTALVGQLQTLHLPRDVAKPLKKFAGGLGKRLEDARELPLLLGELSVLQSHALAAVDGALEPARPGLLERLFGAREPDPPAEPPSAQAVPAPASGPLQLGEHALHPANDEPELEEQPRLLMVAAASEHAPGAAPTPATARAEVLITEHAQPTDEAAAPDQAEPVAAEAAKPLPDEADPEPEAQAYASGEASDSGTPPVEAPPEVLAPATQAMPGALLDVLPLPQAMVEGLVAASLEDPAGNGAGAEGFDLPANQEPTYSSVAAHIEGTLLKMLDDLVLPQRLLEKAQSMRERLEQGLNWYELLPLLDDLAVMTLAINDNGQQELQRYLQQINERLAWFQEQLHQASQGQADTQDEARQLDDDLREQVGGLQSVAAEHDADGLKRLLESRLDGLLGSMDAHRRRREAREEEVAERMRGLSERVASMEQEAEAYRDVLEEQRQKALLDPLTGLPNRAGWSERLEALVAQREADNTPTQVAIMDLDHFKSINDNYGHLAGDRVLKIVADQLRRQLREGDFMARFGGEEFVAVFPNSAPEAAYQVLENMRQVIEACPFHFKGMRIVVTVSIGTAALRAEDPVEAALKRADQALYRAKDTGRNRIENG